MAIDEYMIPVFKSIGTRAVRAQAYLDEAVTARALERFFHDRQAYPVQLTELVPAYLACVPTDVIDGEPLRYRQTPDGRDLPYAVGWNGRDDGGTVVWSKTSGLDPEKSDWVRQYAELKNPNLGR